MNDFLQVSGVVAWAVLFFLSFWKGLRYWDELEIKRDALERRLKGIEQGLEWRKEDTDRLEKKLSTLTDKILGVK